MPLGRRSSFAVARPTGLLVSFRAASEILTL